ncbi:MAG TPA: GEVED domain-containing protein, partial [Pirellulaceae bacterium]|nr:GEVED domain-containing protein [Pirellulaceae bacterium]
ALQAPALQLTPVNLGNGKIHLGSTAAHSLLLNSFLGEVRFASTGVPQNVADGDSITISDGTRVLHFEFDRDGQTRAGSIPIGITKGQTGTLLTHRELGAELTKAIQTAILNGRIDDDGGALVATDLRDGRVHLGGSRLHEVRRVAGASSQVALTGQVGVQQGFGIQTRGAALQIVADRVGLQMRMPTGGGADVSDGQFFTITEHVAGGTRSAIFEFDTNGFVRPGRVGIHVTGTESPMALAGLVKVAIETADIGLSPITPTSAVLDLGSASSMYVLDLSNSTNFQQSGISDGQTFVVDNGVGIFTFEFDIDQNVSSPNIAVPIVTAGDAARVATQIASVVGTSGLGFNAAQLPRSLGGGVLDAGEPLAMTHLWDLSNANLTKTGQAGGIRDGETFTVTLNGVTRTFELDSDGSVQTGGDVISFDNTSSAEVVANAMVPVLRGAGLGLNPVSVGLGAIELLNATSHILNFTPLPAAPAGASHLRQIGVLGDVSANSVSFIPAAEFLGAQVAVSIQEALADSSLTSVRTSLGGGARVFVDGATNVAAATGIPALDGVRGSVTFVGAVKDLAKNPLKANQLSGETQFTITLGEVRVDFGDAMDPLTTFDGQYPTKQSNNGAAHIIVGDNPLRLGATVDAELDGQPTNDAVGDDNNGVDDEDGVMGLTGLVRGVSTTFTVNASAAAFLDAWIDFNQNGNWEDRGEQILSSVRVNAGNNVFTIRTPEMATLGQTTARFRISSLGGLRPTGLAR